MKLNNWTLCFVALLCIGTVKSWTYFPTNVDFLKETGDSEVGENDVDELHEGDLAKQLDESKRLLKDLDNKVSRFYGKPQREEPVTEDLCLKNCGVKKGDGNDNLKCVGDGVTTAECECKEPDTMSFDANAKECKTCVCAAENTECVFVDGVENCPCKKGFALKGEKCEECVCDDENADCVYDGDDTKCPCKKGFALKGDKCETIAVIEKENCNEKCGDDREKIECEGDKTNVDSITCVCTDTKTVFKEKQCVDPCENFCKNNGVCEVSEATGDPTCRCPAQFDGSKCENDRCEDHCKNGGTCKVDEETGVLSCKCPARFDGPTCETDKCAGYCENGGTCSYNETTEALSCECKAEFNGPRCETAIKDNCKVVCGESADVECGGNKTDITKVTCTCKNKKIFHERDCKEDLCLKECNIPYGAKDPNLKCTGDGVNEAKCECVKSDKMSFDKSNKKCKTDYCKTVCGEAKCDKPFVSKQPKDCICEGENESFDQKEKICKECDCGENGTCSFNKDGSKICSCKSGYLEKDGICSKYEEVCKQVCGESADVECRGSKTNITKITCFCKNNKLFHERDCKEDLCLTNCGIKYGSANTNVKCTGDGVNTAECECVKPETMSFDEKSKTCKIDNCRAICGEVTCGKDKFDKVTATDCKCDEKNQVFDPKAKECKVDYCFEKCGADYNTAKTGVVCKGDKFKEEDVKCSCKDGKTFYEKKCKKQCSPDKKDCKNFAPCDTFGDSDELHFCTCHDGTEGDMCDTITACKTELQLCTGNRGKCIFDEDSFTARCNCTVKNTDFYAKVKYCEVQCADDTPCKGGKKCNKEDGFCACKEGLGGDNCKEVVGCTKELQEKCKKAEAKCVYSETAENHATCECLNNNFTYKATEDKCVDPYCAKEPCKGGAKCVYNEAAKMGSCVCSDGKYYDYQSNACIDPDGELKCLLRKTPCEKNEVCENGVCVCAENYEREGEGKPCKENFCPSSDHCFDNGECVKKDGSCKCGDLKYFNGEECEDAHCVWKDFKKNCSCPDGLTGEAGKCAPYEGEKICDKDCGYGYCIQEGEGESKTISCKCMPFAEYNEKKDTCILDVNKCATKKLTGDLKKCDCSGPDKTVNSLYKQSAEDGITCELVTCADKSAQEDCAARGGQCKMNWKKTDSKIPGYYCECPTGYIMDNERKMCTDKCSLPKHLTECAERDQFCYNSVLDGEGKPTSDCKCPPPLKKKSETDGSCSEIAEHVYLLKNIPVLKKKYEQKGGINTVLLNADIVLSLKQSYEKLTHGYLYDYKVDGNVLRCSAWLNFNEDPKVELEIVKTGAVKFPNTTCDDCDPDALVWPPHLMLSGDLTEVSFDGLNFCSDEVKNSLCGKHAACDKETKKCSCPKGFRTAPFSIRDRTPRYMILRCEDIDECDDGTDECTGNTTCVNVPGDYRCDCKAGYKKTDNATDPNTDKGACSGLCSPNPCGKGTCTQKGNMFNCQCEAGVGGSLCDRKDTNYEKAKRATVVVGAVLGVLLGVLVIGFAVYYKKIRKNSGSQDFMPATRHNAAEMTERRHMRGVTNKGYE